MINNASTIEIIPVFLTGEQTDDTGKKFSWKEYLGKNNQNQDVFGRTSAGRNSCTDQFKFAARSLPGLEPPSIASYPFSAFVVEHTALKECDGFERKFSILQTSAIPESCDQEFYATILSSFPFSEVCADTENGNIKTQWQYQITRSILDKSNTWISNVPTDYSGQPINCPCDGSEEVEENTDDTDIDEDKTFIECAYNLLEKNNTNELAYGYEINKNNPPELLNSPGFEIKPIPDNTIVKVTKICTNGLPINYFSAPNPIDGNCLPNTPFVIPL
jgi:hypothetical protein